MKRILLSLAMIALVSSTAVGATKAYFSDSETSSGNTLAAGTISLTVNQAQGSSVPVLVNASNLVPGAYTGVGVVNLKNIGSLPGKLSAKISNIHNLENGVTAPEITAGESPDNTVGDLGPKLSFIVKQNYNPWDHFLYMTGLADGATLTTLHMSAGDLVLAPGEERQFQLNVQWPVTATDDMAQGDSVNFDLTFRLDQVL